MQENTSTNNEKRITFALRIMLVFIAITIIIGCINQDHKLNWGFLLYPLLCSLAGIYFMIYGVYAVSKNKILEVGGRPAIYKIFPKVFHNPKTAKYTIKVMGCIAILVSIFFFARLVQLLNS